MSHQLLEKLLWGMNFLIVFETIFQLMPLIKGHPYGSRRASLVGMFKYGATMTINMLLGNLPMTTWLLIGLLKETCAWIMLKKIKLEEGISI